MTSGNSPTFLTINEACESLGEPAHVLRFWESKFQQVRPVKRPGGRRYYREDDILLLRGITVLIRDSGYTIRGVQRMLRERGARAVICIGKGDPLVDTLPRPPESEEGGRLSEELREQLEEAIEMLGDTASQLRQ